MTGVVTGLTHLGPLGQRYLLEARQMQALSFAVHISLVCFGIALPARRRATCPRGEGRVRRTVGWDARTGTTTTAPTKRRSVASARHPLRAHRDRG